MNLRQEIENRFNDHGVQLDIDDRAPLVEQFIQQDPEIFREVLLDIADANDLNLTGDDQTRSLLVSIALVNALENGADAITEADIEAAQREVSESLASDDDISTDNETQKASDESEDEPKQTETRKRHNPALKETVYNLVQDNPDVQKAEMVELTLKQIPDAHEGTVAVHYYNARKEFDLQPIGKRGRPANSGKLPQIRAMIQENPEASRDEIIQRSVNELGLKESTAANYYSKARK